MLRRELASFVIPVGGDVFKSKPELVEHVIEATQGPPRVDVAEVRRSFEIGRQAANARLVALKDEPHTGATHGEAACASGARASEIAPATNAALVDRKPRLT